MTEALHRAAGWREILTREHVPKLLVLAMAIWLHAANSMLAATTMPSAVDEIGGLHLISWAFALYLMGSIVAAASISLVVVALGLRRTMMTATLVYAVGCVICATAPSMPLLLVGRTVQGLGGGALVALVYVSQDRFFPNHFVPKTVACLSMVWMTSSFCSPMIGGAFATAGIWRMAFWAFAVQAVLLLVAVHYLLRRSPPELELRRGRFPVVRLLFLAGAILLISLAGMRFDPLYSPLLVLLGCGSLWFFLRRDRGAEDNRMLPAQATDLGHGIGSGVCMTFLLTLSIMSFLVYGPVILIKLYGMTPLGAGIVVMLEAVGWSLAALAFSGTRPQSEPALIRAGAAVVLIGLVAMAVLLPNGPLWAVVIAVVLSNGGFGMTWGFIIKRIIRAADDADKDRAASLLPTTQQTGFALGAAFSGLIANGLGFAADMDRAGVQTVAFWLFAGFVPIALLGNVAAWRFTKH